MKIYVASSWRNTIQPSVVDELLKAGFEVYDFRNPAPGETGFHWHEIDEDWRNWTADQFASALDHPIAVAGFRSDFDAMKWADACVLVNPCGRSAHLEAGYFVGAGKLLVILANGGEPELMYSMSDVVATSMEEVVLFLKRNEEGAAA
ncbi:MAG: hypothetical protein JO279_18330 [Verrucomicrobia bacterium]|nr:hypothetical protein [Verrucomicrobiota bacterium]